MFSSFIQYEWSSDAKGVAGFLLKILHVAVGCDSVTVVDIGRGTTSSLSYTSLLSSVLLF